MDKFLRVSNMLDKLCLQAWLGKGESEGGSITEKSSRIWQTKEIEHLLSKIDSIASESWLNKKGAFRNPNGRTLS